MRRFTGHVDEKWGSFVDVRVNAAEVLERELARKRCEGVVLLGSVTDAYQPVERKYKVTRAIAEVLLKHQCNISILTKSSLVLRDLDLFVRFTHCEVGLTITTLDERVRRYFEPYSSSVPERVEALRSLHKNGVRTYVFIGPVLPKLTDIEAIIRAVRDYIDAVWVEALNIRCGNWSDIESVLRVRFPQLLPDFKHLASDGKYWDEIGEQARTVTASLGVPLVGYYRH